MKSNNRLYKYVIILSALSGTSLVFSDENKANGKKDVLAEMPAAPSGPYRSQGVASKALKQDKSVQAQAPKVIPQPPQPRMPVPNMNQNRQQPIAPPQWAQRPPQPRMPVPNMNQNRPQPVQVPDWVKNPPYGPKPPAWVTNPPQPPVYGYGRPINSANIR